MVGSPTKNTWIIDFGTSKDEAFARQYEAPFAYVEKHVYPAKSQNRRAARAANWWLHSETAPGMRQALAPLSRYIATPRVSKYRLFVWVSPETLADDGTYVIAREDDYFFGVLHSKLHEVWSLRMGTWLGKGNDPRYTPTTTFETFPFPWSPGQEPTPPTLNPSPNSLRSEGGTLIPLPSDRTGMGEGARGWGASPLPSDRMGMGEGGGGWGAYSAIAIAAQTLHTERHAWLNPPNLKGKALQDRTLTNLYNALNVWRGDPHPASPAGGGGARRGLVPAAADFAPRLDELHKALDQAVCAAYGWDAAILADEEAILRHLLALNLQRAGV